MAAKQTEVESQAIELATEAFEAFCEDISGMFGVDMNCDQQEVTTETTKSLGKRFKKLVAVNHIKAEGILDGTFEIILSREGLFILAGAIAMPEQMTSLLEKCVGPANIKKNLKSGSLKEAKAVSDTIVEVGNLLVGSWDRVFREKLDGHGHFAQINTFIGNPWDKPEEKIGLASDEELLFVPYEMTIGSYPAFKCGVLFPKTIFGPTSDSDSEQAAPPDKEETEEKADVEEKAEAEEKASDEKESTVKEEAEAEAGEKASDEKESVAKEEAEAAAETKSHDADTDVPDNVVQQEEAKTIESAETKEQPVSETIQRMAQSPAGLPGEHTLISLAICAKDIMQKNVVWGNPDDSVQQALTKMQQADSGYMMIGTNGTLEGIVSRSDITGAISPYLRPIFSKWRRPLDDATLNIKTKWVMSRPVRTIKPETSLAAIMENMRQFGGRCLPVVDRQDKVQGLVTVFDIFKALLKSNSNISTTGKTLQAPPLV